jgi:hypothetical protein
VAKTCTITAEVYVGRDERGDRKLLETKTWRDVDIMKTSHSRGWCTRQFNLHWQWRKRDASICVSWECRHDDNGVRFYGELRGVNSIKIKDGIFDA